MADCVVAEGVPVSATTIGTLHRVGGATIDNLRLKPKEAILAVPGISVLKADQPGEAAPAVRSAFPRARGLHIAAETIGSTTAEAIRGGGL
jgi:hypothetical protein